MGVLTYNLNDGDLTSFKSTNDEDVHLIKIGEDTYALDTMSYGEFLDKNAFEKAKQVLEKCVSVYPGIEVKSDNETSLYLTTTVIINQKTMSNEQEFKVINDASNTLKEAFDDSDAFWKLINHN